MYYVIMPTNSDLYHHGVLGQKWGKQNGPPYPLDGADHSASERKAGWRKSLSERKEKKHAERLNILRGNIKNQVEDSEFAKRANEKAQKITTKYDQGKYSLNKANRKISKIYKKEMQKSDDFDMKILDNKEFKENIKKIDKLNYNMQEAMRNTNIYMSRRRQSPANKVKIEKALAKEREIAENYGKELTIFGNKVVDLMVGNDRNNVSVENIKKGKKYFEWATNAADKHGRRYTMNYYAMQAAIASAMV